MAGGSIHFRFKRGGVGKAVKHACYIIGRGKYTQREDVFHVASGNMPQWADDTLVFWDAADSLERSNGRTYHEFEFAIPRELTLEEALDFVKGWIEQKIGTRHPYLYSIHNKLAADGLPNIHCHAMFSDRTCDGVERSPELFFRRPASRYRDRKTGMLRDGDPAKGGVGKDRRWNNRRIVEELRVEFEVYGNKFLVDHGHQPRLDLRSNAERGLGAPEPKVGPQKRKNDRWRAEKSAAVATLRQQRRCAQALQEEIQVTKSELRALRRERARQDANTCRDADSRAQQRPNRSPLAAMRAEPRQGRTVYRWGSGAAAGLAALVDKGDYITLTGKSSQQKANALAELAKAKGWTGLVLTGSPEFKRLAVREALREGLSVVNPELASLVAEEKYKMHQQLRADLARRWLTTAAKVDALEAANLKGDPERLQRLFDSNPEAQRWALIQRQRADGVPDALLGFQLDHGPRQGGVQGLVRHVGKNLWIEDRPGHVVAVPLPNYLPSVRPGQRIVVQPNGEFTLPDRENTPCPR